MNSEPIDNKSSVESFLGFNWINNAHSPRPGRYIFKSSALYSIHSRFIWYIETEKHSDEVIEEFEDVLNALTNDQFGKLKHYDVKISKATRPLFSHPDINIIYTIMEFNNGPIPLVLIDWWEKEQPLITDLSPTPNPNFLRVGVKLENGNIFRLV